MPPDATRFVNFDALSVPDGGPAVLVFGGSTFMGRALVERLVAKPARVCLVNRGRTYWGISDPSRGKAAKLRADRGDAEMFVELVDAATNKLGGKPWDLVADFSAYNTTDMRVAMDGLKGRFEKYAYISSDSVYEVSDWAGKGWGVAGQDNPAVAEADAVRPSDSETRRRLRKADTYGHGKLEGEEELLAGLARFGGNGKGIGLRLPDVIGPYDDTLRLWAYWHWLQAGPDEPPPVHDERAAKRPRHAETATTTAVAAGEHAFGKDTVPLSFVFSQDVARFIVELLDSAIQPKEAGGRFDAVNVGCTEQHDLREFLGLLSEASSLGKQPPVREVDRPRTFLPSVDRPWNLSMNRLTDVYGFRPTPLREVLAACAAFFASACNEFPREALRSVGKLPPPARRLAAKRSGLPSPPPSSSSSSSSS